MINKGKVSKKHANSIFYCGIFLVFASSIPWFTSEKIDWLYHSINTILAIFLTIYGFRLRKSFHGSELKK